MANKRPEYPRRRVIEVYSQEEDALIDAAVRTSGHQTLRAWIIGMALKQTERTP